LYFPAGLLSFVPFVGQSVSLRSFVVLHLDLSYNGRVVHHGIATTQKGDVMAATYYMIALIASIVVILLALFALVMALFRFSKAKNSSDPQVQKGAAKALVSGILYAIFIFVVGAGLLFVVFYYIAR
jgi:hypothetical protein